MHFRRGRKGGEGGKEQDGERLGRRERGVRVRGKEERMRDRREREESRKKRWARGEEDEGRGEREGKTEEGTSKGNTEVMKRWMRKSGKDLIKRTEGKSARTREGGREWKGERKGERNVQGREKSLKKRGRRRGGGNGKGEWTEAGKLEINGSRLKGGLYVRRFRPTPCRHTRAYICAYAWQKFRPGPKSKTR